MTNISVLVPIYNVEAYLKKCLVSLCAQTLQADEYIFVNDASSDTSMDILTDFLKENQEFACKSKIINLSKNGGVGNARYVAINNATKDYILFVDADDYLEPNMIELLYSKALDSGADIVVCDAYEEYINKQVLLYDYVPQNPQNYFLSILYNDKSYCSVWNKLIKKSLLANISDKYQEMRYAEDRMIMTQLYLNTSHIQKIDIPIYHYNLTNIHSISHNRFQYHFDDYERFWEEIVRVLSDKNNKDYDDIIKVEKLKNKSKLILECNDRKLMQANAKMFSDIDYKIYRSQLKQSQYWTLWLLDKKCYVGVLLLRYLLLLKGKVLNK